MIFIQSDQCLGFIISLCMDPPWCPNSKLKLFQLVIVISINIRDLPDSLCFLFWPSHFLFHFVHLFTKQWDFSAVPTKIDIGRITYRPVWSVWFENIEKIWEFGWGLQDSWCCWALTIERSWGEGMVYFYYIMVLFDG